MQKSAKTAKISTQITGVRFHVHHVYDADTEMFVHV